MSRIHTRLAAAILALSALTGTAHAFSAGVDLPNLSFPDDSVTVSTKSCETGAAAPCPAER